VTSPEGTIGRGARLAVAAMLCGLSVTVASACSTAQLADQLGKAQYVAEMRALVAQVKADGESLRADLVDKGKSLDQVVGRASADLVKVRVRLKEIRPPDQIAALHERLTKVVGQLSGVFNQAQQALLTGDFNGLLALAPQAQGLSAQVGQIAQEFVGAGYRIDTGAR
jgi:hypothetical protein